MIFHRSWAMPHHNTFEVKPIGEFVRRFMSEHQISVDPFARNNEWATHRNDLNPETSANHHMDAEEFLAMLACEGVRADLGIIDPPYSPRQISECYKGVGKAVGMKDTQSSALYKRVRDAMDHIIRPGGVVLSFGWNSAGMGIKRGYEIIEVQLVCHGSAHNDTICIAERKSAGPRQQSLL